MPLSKKRMRERKQQDRMSNLVKPKPLYPARPDDMESRLKAQGFALDGNRSRFDRTDVKPKPTRLPLYNPRVHKTGDRVRMPSGIEVIVPELDEEGMAIPDC